MKKNGKKTVFFCILHYFVLYLIIQKAHLSLSSSKSDNCQQNQESVNVLRKVSPRHPATFTLSHFHTFLYAEQLLKKFYPTFGQKYPVSYPFYPYFRPQKCRFSVGLKYKKWGARGDNNNLYICIIFFWHFRCSKSVKV